MIRLTITPAAYAVVAATHPASARLKRGSAPNGEFYVWLEPQYVEHLRAARKLGESFSEVIVRLRRRAKAPDVRLGRRPSIAHRLVAKKLQANHKPSRDAMVYGARWQSG
jgi:hypothetical protein